MSGGDLINAAISTEELEVSATITTEEPEIAATLSDLRYLVFQGLKGDTGDSAYDLAVELGFVGTEAEWIASLKGEKGDTGFSPEITSSAIPGGHRIDITNELGPDSFNVMDGEDGADGVSPTVQTEAITGGHRVTITDTDGAHTFDVMDGEGSQGGAVDSVNGKTGAVVLDASDVGALPESYTPPVSSVNGKTGAVVLGAADVHALPDSTVIPPTVTEQTVAGWGFTKNTGTYVKPSTGIPASDLAQAVQTSLGKADTALQQHQSLAGYATESYVQTQIAAIPDELPAVTASDNGKVLGVVNGAWGLKDDETGGGGGGTSPTLLGTTPLKLTADADNLILSGSGEISYALQSDTVADFPVLSGTANNATVTQENGVYALTAGSGASAWYQAYIDITVTGLVVNQSYNFIFDAAGCEYDETTHRTIGHYILYDGSGNTLVTRGATDTNRLNSYAFTAPTTSVRVRWYPATNNTFSSGVSVATVNAIYINRTGTTEHTAILDASGTFTDSTTIPGVPAGTTVTSTPSCSVYSKASESGGAALPLEGKTVVCFGDSLFGLYRGSTSAPAFVEKVTGATVYNVGFGGCRMSDHPSHGYAEFSMWALAHAIATDTWTDQDTYVSQGSDYFPEQLATLKGIDFSTVDYAVIHYGTNDFGGGVAIGADSASTVHNTLCGALRYSIETLLTAYPKLRIFVSLPCFRFWTVDGQTVYSDTYTNSQNKTLVEYVAALRAVAGEYNIPVIENYTGNGINRVNASTFLGDGTHHNADGRERFGTYIAENLISGGSCGIAAAESNSFGGGA